MLYKSYLQHIRDLEFIQNDENAESALKAGLGILISVMDDDRAKRLTRELPDSLDYTTLKGNQIGPVPLSFDEAVTSLANQRNMDAHEARVLLIRSIHAVKSGIDSGLLAELFSELPEDWRAVIANA